MSNPKTTPRREEARPDNRPGRYRIDHPDTPMPLDVRAWQMWAVHPSDLDAMGFKTREAFFLKHLEAVNGENARLRQALAGISLATQRNDSPAHVTVQQVGREARAALDGEGEL